MKKTLDLGCGALIRNPFGAEELYGIDIETRPDKPLNVVIADLAVEGIPFDNDFFDFVTAYDVLEHIPRLIFNPGRRNSFIELMNEIYRVLKEDGIFFSSTPMFPHPSAFVDPTHVNIMTKETIPYYFTNSFNEKPWAVDYGFKGCFSLLNLEDRESHIQIMLKKVK
jgi:SAM-dependent methyltransferase